MGFGKRLKSAGRVLFRKEEDPVMSAKRIITDAFQLNLGNVGLWKGANVENNRQQVFEQVSLKDLESEYLETLLPKVVKSDPALDQAVDFFTTFVSQAHKVTAETSKGERAIGEINDILEANNTPLSLVVAHCASSLIVRGDICAETEFDKSAKPKNFWVNEPYLVEWRYLSDDGNARWALGHKPEGTGAPWQEITSPNVYYLAGNPLIGERTSRSPLQTSLFPALSQSSMVRALQTILDIHAWAQTFFKVRKMDLIELQKETGEIADVNAEVLKAMELIKKLAAKAPDETMGMTDDIEPVQLTGGGDNLTWVPVIGGYYDKFVSMGSKLPSTVGGPSEHADYSTKYEALFYSSYLQTGQEKVGATLEWGYTRFMRSMGVTDDPIYTAKSVNVESRLIEAKAFQEIMEGINKAVQAGMPLPLAIDFFEEEAGQNFSADLKARIAEAVPKEALGGTSAEEANQDNSLIIQAGSTFIQKKIANRLKDF